MSILRDSKEHCKNIRMDQIPQKSKCKSEIEFERDRQYETKWIWYHTILAAVAEFSTIRQSLNLFFSLYLSHWSDVPFRFRICPSHNN